MKAIIVESPGGREKLKIGEIEKPVIKENEILVKVFAAGINRADVMQREGKYPPPAGASTILGLDMAGVVEEVGTLVRKWKKGDKVFGLLPGGGYAEYCAIQDDMAMRIPSNLNFEEAASIPEVFLTAYQALAWNTKLKKGESILIHAAASGVGTAAIQIAKELGAEIYITASKPKHEVCLKLGALKAIDYKTENFVEKIREFTANKGVDVIIDFISGPYFKQNIDCLKIDGRLTILAFLGGGRVDNFDLRQVLSKRLSIIGSALRSRSRDYQIKLTKDFSEFALDKFESGKLKPIVDKVFDMADVASAHQYLEENKNTGKLVLKID